MSKFKYNNAVLKCHCGHTVAAHSHITPSVMLANCGLCFCKRLDKRFFISLCSVSRIIQHSLVPMKMFDMWKVETKFPTRYSNIRRKYGVYKNRRGRIVSITLPWGPKLSRGDSLANMRINDFIVEEYSSDEQPLMYVMMTARPFLR